MIYNLVCGPLAIIAIIVIIILFIGMIAEQKGDDPR